MGTEVPVLLGKTLVSRHLTSTEGCFSRRPHGRDAKRRAGGHSDVETLAAAAFTLGFRVLKLEGLVQALFDKIHQRPVDQRQTQGIHHHLHAARFENRVFGTNFISIIHDIRESRAAGLLDPDSQAQTGSALRQVRSNPIGRRFRQQYRHTASSSAYGQNSGRDAIHNTPMTPTHGTRARFFSELMPARHGTSSGRWGRQVEYAMANAAAQRSLRPPTRPR